MKAKSQQSAARRATYASLLIGSLLISLAAQPARFAESKEVRRHSDNERPCRPNIIDRRSSKLRKHDRERLAEAVAEGKRKVTLLVAAAPHTVDSFSREAAALGAEVLYRADDVDYVRLKVRTEDALALSSLEGIESICLDGTAIYPTGTGQTDGLKPQDRDTPPLPGPLTPAENSYLPTREIGAPQFISQHPTFDGRGVTIGVFEGYPADVLCPELQTALTLDGRETLKLVDVLLGYDADSEETPTRVRMKDEVEAVNGRFSYLGSTYLAPRDGRFRIGMFDEAAFTSSQIAQDVNRDGNPPGSSRLFAVLWDERSGSIWVDSNQNKSLADEKEMSNYGDKHAVGIFGHDNPATPERETVGFVVLTDKKSRLVYVIPTSFAVHATAVTSVAIGRSFFGGAINGSAPGASYIATHNTSSQRSLVESMIMLMRDPRVDLVTAEYASETRLNDGRSPVGIIWDRLVERYRKPIFTAASNDGPGVNTIGDISSAALAISVGGYINRETWLSNYGVKTPKPDHLMGLSSRGPAEDGKLKPDLLAPTGILCSTPAVFPSRESYLKLPPGHSISSGTSIASPMAAGAAALLVSAAKQTRTAYDAEHIRWALQEGARFLPGYGSYEQGVGLMNVPAAWEALTHASPLPRISSTAPVSTMLSSYLTEPSTGGGIYEREGWVAGMSASREMVFKRSGPGPLTATYLLHWTGNDGTFKTEDKITLPLDSPKRLTVRVSPATPGVHSAILCLLDPTTGRSVYRTLSTVIAAEDLQNKSGTKIFRASVEYPGFNSHFIRVDKGTRALKVELDIKSGALSLRLLNPAGELFGGYTPEESVDPEFQSGGALERTVAMPEPGVWEILVKNDDLHLKDPNPGQPLPGSYELKATAFGASISYEPRGGSVNVAGNTIDVNITNRLAAFEGGLINTPLSSMLRARIDLPASSGMRVNELEIPPGTEELSSRISEPSDPSADVDLYLYDCTKGRCELRDAGRDAGAVEEVSALHPNPGRWRIVIDPVRFATSSLGINYEDSFSHKALGTLAAAAGETRKHDSESCWTGSVNASIMAIPAAPRHLAARVAIAIADHQVVGYLWDKATRKAVAVEGQALVAETHIDLTDNTANYSKNNESP